jgi:hypothetical protein
MLSRWAIPPSIVPFFVILFVLAVLHAAEASVRGPLVRAVRVALAALAAAALTYAYPVEKLFVPLLRYARLLLVWLVLFPLAGSLTGEYMHVLRAIQGFPLVPIFAAIGIAALVDALARAPLRRALYAVLFVVGCTATLDYTADYFTNYRETSKFAYQYGLREVFAYVLPRQRAFRAVVLDAAIHKPYIYLLFYARRDPRTPNYGELEPPRGDTAVRRIGTFRFERVDSARIAGARLIRRVGDGSATWYRIYETRDHVCVVQRVRSTPTIPGESDLPAKLKLLLARVRGGA